MDKNGLNMNPYQKLVEKGLATQEEVDRLFDFLKIHREFTKEEQKEFDYLVSKIGYRHNLKYNITYLN